MTTGIAVWLLVAVAFVAANLPWVSERFFVVLTPKGGHKRAWQRWFEWLVLYAITGAVAVGLEQKLTGERYAQGWEFYATTLCLFLVFALPGFIYRHDLRHHFARKTS
ncbi:MAG: DUF2818 family protein [Thiohalomonadaceae bacterium]